MSLPRKRSTSQHTLLSLIVVMGIAAAGAVSFGAGGAPPVGLDFNSQHKPSAAQGLDLQEQESQVAG